MTLPLSPDVLRAAYDYLNVTEPFRRWNLPDGEDVVFKVLRSRVDCGCYWKTRGRHHIGISAMRTVRTVSLIETMAHEMVHLYEEITGIAGKAEHGAAFRHIAAIVCRRHGFDPALF